MSDSDNRLLVPVEVMDGEKDLYLAKGAEEVWVCDEDGLVVFYNARGEIQRSNQFPESPTTLALDFPPA